MSLSLVVFLSGSLSLTLHAADLVVSSVLLWILYVLIVVKYARIGILIVSIGVDRSV